jgi:hypothetical protein
VKLFGVTPQTSVFVAGFEATLHSFYTGFVSTSDDKYLRTPSHA